MNGKTTYGPKIRRRSIRLPGYDYAEAGFYFVTICTKENKSVFGDIADGRMELNRFGYVVRKSIRGISDHFKSVRCSPYVVMPNHAHMIIQMKNGSAPVGAGFPRPGKATCPAVGAGFPRPPMGGKTPRGGGTPPLRHLDRSRPMLGQVVAWLKYESTKCMNGMMGTSGNSIWQRNYWERVIRSERELFDTAEYIRNNPKNWRKDWFYENYPPMMP